MGAQLITNLFGFGQDIVAGASGVSATMPTMFDAQNEPDIAQNWMWTATIVGVPGLPAFDNLLLADMNVPFEAIGVDTRFRGGFSYNFPKFVTVSPVTLTLHEVQTFVVTNYFAAWKNKIVDSGASDLSKTGNYFLPHDYLGNMIVTLFDTMGIPALQILLAGVWPDHQNDFNLQNSSSGGLQVTVNLAVNRSAIVYASATLLDSPLAKIINGNPLASLRALAGTGLASLTSTLGNTIGSVAGPALGGL